VAVVYADKVILLVLKLIGKDLPAEENKQQVPLGSSRQKAAMKAGQR